MMKKTIALVSLFFLFLTACSTSTSPDLIDPDGDSVDPVGSSELQPESQMPVPEITDPAEIPEEMIVIEEPELPGGADVLVDLAKADLAQRLGIEISAIAIVLNKPITWPDATLGCPKPGMDFSPVEIPGYILQLSVDGHIYTYHTDDVNRVILCPAEGEGPDEIFIMP